MPESFSYKDMASPFNDGRFPVADAPVDPMKTTSRRRELKRFMVWLVPVWEPKLTQQWHTAEQKICEDYARSGLESISESWFEYEVDKAVYTHFLKLIKDNLSSLLKSDIAGWPWNEISAKDVTTQQDKKSTVYERYLQKQKVAAIAAKKNESAMEGVEGPAAEKPSNGSNNLNPAAPAFEPSAETAALEDGEVPTSEQAQTLASDRGELRRRRNRKNKSLQDSMFAGGRGSGRSRGRGGHRAPPPQDEFEWKNDDQMPSDQNNQVLGASGSEVTGVTQQDVDMDRLNRPLFEPDTLALTKKGIESSLFAPATVSRPPKITNEMMLESMSNNGSDHQKRSRLWEKVYGNMAIRKPIVGPFEMGVPACIPTQVYISEERLAKANDTYLRDVKITFDRQTRRLTVGFTGKQGPGSFPSRMELVSIWQAVKQWMQEVCSEMPSCLDDVIYRVLRMPTTIPDQSYQRAHDHVEESANVMPDRLKEIGQELPGLREQLRPLLSTDFIRTKASVQNWLNTQPKPYRAIRAATAEWLMACDSTDEAMVIEWSIQTKEHVQEMRGEKGTELK
ncbi:hypothetical protein FBULB1_13424 [Fusarium bulbicola]|nr:hypothetical protein FBULB1_13424 [Fusarium bulbicola]